jgi:hypothetical protein
MEKNTMVATGTRVTLEQLLTALRLRVPARTGLELVAKYPRVKAPALFRGSGFFDSREPMQLDHVLGLRVFSDERVTEGKRLHVEFFLPDRTSVTVHTRVHWTTALQKGAGASFEVGLQLLHTPPESLLSLLPFLDFD